MLRIFVTGGVGFIGSNLVGELLKRGNYVTAYDNLSLGKKDFIQMHLHNPGFRFHQNDLLNFDKLKESIRGHDVVFHMAANSDIGYGAQVTDVDLTQGTMATYNVLEAMRLCGIKKIVFASTSAIYGDAEGVATAEDYGPLFPISLYGASKLACEGLISAFCHNYNMKAWIFRFANVVGKNATHGAVFDFIRKLRKNPRELEILGDGKQAKPYLYVKECVEGMIYGFGNSDEEVNYFNLACEGATSVEKIADIIVEEMGLKGVEYKFTGGQRGWPGDVPQVKLDPKKMAQLGWNAKLTSDEAVYMAAKALLKQM